MIAHIHGRENGEQEEADPELVATRQQFRIGAHHECESLAMTELVIAPLFEPFENRMEPLFGMTLEMAIDGDVARIADLLRQIGRVEDELWLEVSVFFGTCQKAQINANVEILQHFIDEAGMARFIAGHESKKITNFRIGDPLLDLCV